jgi:hypothetical protein
MAKLPHFTAYASLKRNMVNYFNPIKAQHFEAVSPSLKRVPTNLGGGLGCYYRCIQNGGNKSVCMFFCDVTDPDLWVVRW